MSVIQKTLIKCAIGDDVDTIDGIYERFKLEYQIAFEAYNSETFDDEEEKETWGNYCKDLGINKKEVQRIWDQMKEEI